MPHLINLTGTRFSKLLVLGRADNHPKNGRVRWNCVCDCGTTKAISGDKLQSGNTVSCGCYRHNLIARLSADNPAAYGFRHGLTRSATYRSWLAMMSRCYRVSPKDGTNYSNYKMRGIEVED